LTGGSCNSGVFPGSPDASGLPCPTTIAMVCFPSTAWEIAEAFGTPATTTLRKVDTLNNPVAPETPLVSLLAQWMLF